MSKQKPKTGMGRMMQLAMTKKPLVIASVILSSLAAVASFIPYIGVCKSFFSKVLKLLAFQGVWMFLYSRFPLFFPLSGKNKGKSYCTLSSSFAASRLASLLACA